MFWNGVAGVYDVFADGVNARVNRELSARVAAGNVLHLLDEPRAALVELGRVCKDGGMVVIPTYLGRRDDGSVRGLSALLGCIGVKFGRQLDLGSYCSLLQAAGYGEVHVELIEGRLPCALGTIRKTRPVGWSEA